MSVNVTDRTLITTFISDEEAAPIFKALGIESFDEIDRDMEVALIHAYGAGFEDGEFVGGMK